MIKETIASSNLTDLLRNVADVVKLAFDDSTVSIYESSNFKSLFVRVYDNEEPEKHEFEINGMMTEEEKEKKTKEIEDFRNSILNEYRYITWFEDEKTKEMSAVKLSKTYDEAVEVLEEISEEYDSQVESLRGTELGDCPAVWANYVRVGSGRYYTTYENPDDIFM